MGMSTWTRRGAAVLLLALLLLPAACGSNTAGDGEAARKSGEDAQVKEELPEEAAAPEASGEALLARDMREKYRVVLDQASSYVYWPESEPTGVYRYALVPMQTAHAFPGLLVEQQSGMGIGYIRVFQYDPESREVLQPEEVLLQGVGDAGGFRGSLSAAGDRNGVLASSFTSGSGEGSIQRTVVEGGSLVTRTLWEGNFFDETNLPPEEPGEVEIVWYDLTDTAPLDAWTADPDFVPPAPGELSEEQPGELPADGDRIVFQGTLGLYYYDEIVRLQGCPDPNASAYGPNIRPPYSDTPCRLIVLDTPQRMTLQSGSPEGGMREDEVRLIVVEADLPEEYNGQHLTFSLDPAEADWPTDVEVPVGQPYAYGIRVLEDDS